MRIGTPMGRQGTSTARVLVSVSTKDGAFFCRWWVGSSVKGIRAKARDKYSAEYPGCTVQFGNALWENNYGAH